MKALKEQIEGWMGFCERSFTNDTVKQYRSISKMLSDHIAANGRAFTQEAVENFLCNKLEKGGSRRLWNCYLICIRNFAKWREQKFDVPSSIHKIQFLKQDPPKHLGIPQFGVHAIRHYFATEMIKRGVNIYKLSKILGHNSVVTTQNIYVHLLPFDLLGETDILD